MTEETAQATTTEPVTKPRKKVKRGRKPGTKPSVALISKADAVRAALKAGAKKPLAGTAFIKEKFGIDIKPVMFSAYKSQFANRKAAKKARKAGGGIVDNGRSAAGHGAGIKSTLDLLVEVRKLNDQYGAETVAKAVQALG